MPDLVQWSVLSRTFLIALCPWLQFQHQSARVYSYYRSFIYDYTMVLVCMHKPMHACLTHARKAVWSCDSTGSPNSGWAVMPGTCEDGGFIAHTPCGWKSKGSEGRVFDLLYLLLVSSLLLKFILPVHSCWCLVAVRGGEGVGYSHIKIGLLKPTTPDSIGWHIQPCIILTVGWGTIELW